MATFRELIVDTLVNCGAGNPESLPETFNITSDASALTPYNRQVANWVREAWTLLQQENENWAWMQRNDRVSLIIGTNLYPTSLLAGQGLTDQVRRWKMSPPSKPLGSPAWYITDPGDTPAVVGGRLRVISYEVWRQRTIGSPNAAHTRPTYVAMAPNRDLCFFPTPDKQYLVDLVYHRAVRRMNRHDQVPDSLPEEYHEVIKWHAVMMATGFDEANATYQWAQQQYANYFNNLKRATLPVPRVAAAIGAEKNLE